MTIRQWCWVLIIMLLFVIPLVEITKQILHYMKYVEFSYLLVGEIVFYWICWFGVIPIMNKVFKKRR